MENNEPQVLVLFIAGLLVLMFVVAYVQQASHLTATACAVSRNLRYIVYIAEREIGPGGRNLWEKIGASFTKRPNARQRKGWCIYFHKHSLFAVFSNVPLLDKPLQVGPFRCLAIRDKARAKDDEAG